MIQFDEEHLEAIERQRHSASGAAKQRRWMALLGPHPGDRVVDVGCGTGPFSRLVAERVAPDGHVVGVDVAPEAIDLANQLTDGTDRGLLSFDVADAASLSFDDATFDGAVCISVLDFCEEPEAALLELHRVLRPGGRLVVASSDQDTRVYYSHDRELGRRVMQAIADRAHDPWIARRLTHLLAVTGFHQLDEVVVTDVEHEFRPGGAGYVLAHGFRDHLVTRPEIGEESYEAWLADLDSCERQGCAFYSVTTYGYLAQR